MNPNDLARLMLEWADLKKKIEEYERIIKREILDIGDSFVVGNVRARYTKGRTTVDYQAACENELDADLFGALSPAYSATTVTIDYKKMATENNVVLSEYTKVSGPSVSIGFDK